jgi:hypothetical protein
MTEATLVKAFKTAMKEEREASDKEFWVDRKQHYDQHESLSDIGDKKHEAHHQYTESQLEFWGWVRETAVKAVVVTIIGGVFTLLTIGFVVWLKFPAIVKLIGG